jgi:fatty-acyl-CoA synthase
MHDLPSNPQSPPQPDRLSSAWPNGVPRHLDVPHTHLFQLVERSAARFPDKPFLVYYDTTVSFAAFKDEAERVAGYLQSVCGVRRGDRVLLYLQNCPQLVIAFHGIVRADACVVPANPMNLTEELRHYVADSGATVAIVAQELLAQIRPLLGDGGVRHLVVVTYSDYLKQPTDLGVPPFIAAPRAEFSEPGVVSWRDVLARDLRPGPLTAGCDDLCVMPYTSGTTGLPKGCMHTHASVLYNAIAAVHWFGTQSSDVYLSVLPFFHVTGMQGSMNGPLYAGCTLVLLPRWDRAAAALLVQRYRVTTWQVIATMAIDFLSQPNLDRAQLASLQRVSGGGAAMPEAIAQKLFDLCGIRYLEGYGMSETIGPTHINPAARPQRQCLGIPIFDIDARVVDPQTLSELPRGEVGEIIVHGPPVMRGYWNNEEATRAAFVEIDGKRFLRTGDLARIDADGYFFMVDRLKRMINAAGFKVWPAEVEALLYKHPAIREACVIAARDARRGETVKAVVVLKEGARGQVSEQSIIDWAHDYMAAYKAPRIVEFVDVLPKSGVGKVQWRVLQEREGK